MASLLERYRELARLHAACDYGDRGAIRRANEAADEMRRIAQSISADDNAAVAEFAALLDDSVARPWVAHHLLEVVRVQGELEHRALAVIEDLAKGDGADAVGEQFWLKQWRAQRAT